MLPSPYGRGLGFWGFRFSRPYLRSLSLRPDDSLTILTMALSIGFGDSVSLHSAIQATRLLTVTSVGLAPTEHTSFFWTRFRTAGFPRYGSKAGLSDEAFPANWFAIVLRALGGHQLFRELSASLHDSTCMRVCAAGAPLGEPRRRNSSATQRPENL